MVWADAGRIRARVVDRSRQRDSGGRGAETKDRRTRRPAPAALAAGETVSTDLDTVSGRAGRTAIVATPLQTGLFSGFGEEPVARAGHEPGRVPQEEVVHGAGARGAGKTLARSVGQLSAPGVVRDARSIESGDRRTGPGGAARSGEPRGRRSFDDPSGRRSGNRTGLRVDVRAGGTLPAEQTGGELSGTESEGTFQRRQAAHVRDQQAGQ